MRKTLMIAVLLMAASLVSAARELVVTNTADSISTGTFRWALHTARSGDVITFDPEVFAPEAPATIRVRSELPFIRQGNLVVDASNAGVILDGSSCASGCMVGLEVASNNNRIQGLQILSFPQAGIVLSGGTQHNMIGGDPQIGVGPAGQGNVISNNGMCGVGIWDQGTAFNTVTGNFIGTDATGRDPLGNRLAGIEISRGAHSNVIGPGNTIAHNGGVGIQISGPGSFANTITQNSIHSNGSLGIVLEGGGNDDLPAPEILSYGLKPAVAGGSACPGCVVEIYSTQAAQGDAYEGSTSAFSLPTLEASLTLQVGNTNTARRLALRTSRELQDNRIGSLMALNEQFYAMIAPDRPSPPSLASFVSAHAEIGVKRMRLLLDSSDFENVDWSAREGWEGSTQLAPRQVATIERFVSAGIDVMCGLIFWDVDAQGKKVTPGYSRFQDEGEVTRYLDFVQQTVRQLRGTAAYYELLNEPERDENIRPGLGTQQYVKLADYINLVERVVPIIRQEDPEARIAVGAVGHIQMNEPGFRGTRFHGQRYLFGLLQSRVMPLVDAVTFHPLYNVTPQGDEIQQYDVGYPYPDVVPPQAEEVQQYYDDYPAFLRRLQATAVANGFQGEFIADEMTWYSPNEDIPLIYPGPPLVFPEAQAAKYYARAIVLHLGMDVTAFVRLIPDLRNLEPRTIQNLSTIMAGHEAIDMPVEINTDFVGPLAYCSFRYPNGDRILALWTDGVAQEEDPGVPAVITFRGLTTGHVTGIDVLHGFEQELIFEIRDGSTKVRGLLVKDYPLLIRLSDVEMAPDYVETAGDGLHRLGDPGVGSVSGRPDRDGDGVPDDEDLCPDWPGRPEASGC